MFKMNFFLLGLRMRGFFYESLIWVVVNLLINSIGGLGGVDV